MKKVSIACIVEGHGEIESVPVLVRRIVAELDPTLFAHIPQPAVRTSRSKLVQPGELEREIEKAARKNEDGGAILILIDADDDCPATLAPTLLKRAQAARPDIPIAVVLAKKEYEAWFLAAAEFLRGIQGLSDTLIPPTDPETIRGAKEWLRKQMEPNRTYSPTQDQLPLTRRFDLKPLVHAPPFANSVVI